MRTAPLSGHKEHRPIPLHTWRSMAFDETHRSSLQTTEFSLEVKLHKGPSGSPESKCTHPSQDGVLNKAVLCVRARNLDTEAR
jgi:hypothetical protein